MFMNTVRVGFARFVMTMMRPRFSQMNSRFVSPGGLVMATGLVKIMFPNALVKVNPKVGGVAGRRSVVLGTRWSCPAAEANPAAKKAMPTHLQKRVMVMTELFAKEDALSKN